MGRPFTCELHTARTRRACAPPLPKPKLQMAAFFFSWAAGRCLPKNPEWGESYGIRWAPARPAAWPRHQSCSAPGGRRLWPSAVLQPHPQREADALLHALRSMSCHDGAWQGFSTGVALTTAIGTVRSPHTAQKPRTRPARQVHVPGGGHPQRPRHPVPIQRARHHHPPLQRGRGAGAALGPPLHAGAPVRVRRACALRECPCALYLVVLVHQRARPATHAKETFRGSNESSP